MKMNRKVRELCVICGDVAKGINFSSLTCSSCKAFFRRHADSTRKIVCSFDDNCHVNQVTRKFCTKCRLKKCLSAGMKKQLIIRNEDELVKKSQIVPSHLSKQNIFEKADLYGKESMHEFQIVFDAETCTNSSYATFDDTVTNETFNTTFEYDSSSPSINSTIDSSTWNPSVLESDIVHRQSTKLETISTTELVKLMTLSLSTLEDYCTDLLTNLDDNTIDKLLIDTEAMDQDNASSIQVEENCILNDVNVHYDEIQSYNPMIELVPKIKPRNIILRDINIFNRELLQPELYLLKELSDACLLLHNPYRRMVQQSNCDHVRWSRMPQYFLHRLVRMSKRLHRFNQFTSQQQAQILKKSLLEMFCIRSVLKYNPNRDSWGLIDDMAKVSVLVPTEMIRPFCSEQRYQRHKNFPKLFRDEWKRDKTIFDLLVSIILFTPRSDDHQYCLEEEYARYTNLLKRYLEMKYPTLQEAIECFNQLLYNIDEMRQLSEDVYKLLRSYSHMLNDCPFLIELLEGGQVQALNDINRNQRDAKKLTTTIEISH